MGRPKIAAAERRSDRITLRLKGAEMTTLEGLAKTWKVSTGEALRRCIELAAKGGSGGETS